MDMDAHPAATCLMVLVGLPGAGKTTLAQALCRHVARHAVTKEHWQNVAHICFDDYHSPQGAIPTPSLPPGTSENADSFTTAHDAPGGAVEPELSHHPEADQSQEFDPRAWKAGRRRALDAVEASLLRGTQTDISDGSRTLPRARQLLIIADDTMHFRGMRYQMFKMARNYRAVFITLHVHLSPSHSLRRNDSRPPRQRVPIEVFRNLQKVLEEPKPGSHYWEKTSLTFDALHTNSQTSVDDVAGSDRLVDEILSMWGPPPPHPPQLQSAEVTEVGRAGNRSSLIHAIDLRTRALLSQTLQRIADCQVAQAQQDATIESTHKTKAAAVLNSARRKILKRFKTIQLERKEREEEGAIIGRNSLNVASDVGQLSLRVSHSGCEFFVDNRVGGNIEKLKKSSGEEFGDFLKNDTNENDIFVLEERGFGEMCRKMEADFGV